MADVTFDSPSEDAIAVLKLLRSHHNVILSGPPGTGKSRLLAEVRHWFRKVISPAFDPSGPVAFPPEDEIEGIEDWLPSPTRTDRQIWNITFHQGTKYRDFVSGLAPNVQKDGAGFIVVRGPLYHAAEYANQDNGAALIQVDEINRGSAVAIFGDAITAIESDKRLLDDGTEGTLSTPFQILDDNGHAKDYYLPNSLYILAAMNEADTSVEPLDVAFLRRFAKYRILPNELKLREYLDLEIDKGGLVPTPSNSKEVFEALVQSWVKINDCISLARGSSFQIGHGIFMDTEKSELPTELLDALDFAIFGWGRLYAHLEEVFFGDTRSLGAVIRAGEDGSPYSLEERFFADAPVLRLNVPSPIDRTNIFAILRAAASGE